MHSPYSDRPGYYTDATIQQVNWDSSKVRDKLKRDIEAHVVSVRATKLSELCAGYEVAFSFQFHLFILSNNGFNCHDKEHILFLFKI
jgi:hypothetical protein